MVRKFTSHYCPCCQEQTLIDVRILHELLDEGMSIFSGLAQPAHPESEEDCLIESEIQIRESDRLKDILLDFIAAFGFTVNENELIDPNKNKWKKRKKEYIKNIKNSEDILNKIDLHIKEKDKNEKLFSNNEKYFSFREMIYRHNNGGSCDIYDKEGNYSRRGYPTLNELSEILITMKEWDKQLDTRMIK